METSLEHGNNEHFIFIEIEIAQLTGRKKIDWSPKLKKVSLYSVKDYNDVVVTVFNQ